MLGFALIALLVFAPLEAWAGSWRWLVVFVAGHVGATLVVAAGLAIAIHINLIGSFLLCFFNCRANNIDFFLSYYTFIARVWVQT